MEYSKEWIEKLEIKQLFETPGITTRNLLLMKLSYFAALRIGEALNTKHEDLRYEDGYSFLILREQKTDKRNWEKQPIPMALYSEMIRYCEEKKVRLQDYIFSSRQSDKMSYQRAYQIVKECVAMAGLKKDITTHSFRRSRATHLLDDGMHIFYVKEFLRHKSIDTTRKYLKLSKKTLFTFMEKADINGSNFNY